MGGVYQEPDDARRHVISHFYKSAIAPQERKTKLYPGIGAKEMSTNNVFIFMAADNDLTKAADKDLEEIKLPDLSPDINLVIQYDSGKRNLFDFLDKKPTERFKIENHHLVKLKEPVLGETNTGDPSVLNDFLTWGIKRFPAHRTIVIIWGHGSGAKDIDPYQSVFRTVCASLAPPHVADLPPERGCCYDNTSGDFLSNPELRKALTLPEKKIDILVFDACLMNMFEVIYEVRDCADMVIGSEATMPISGLPYQPILNYLGSNSDASNVALAEIIVTAFKDSVQAPGNLLTLSAVRTGPIEKVAASLDGFAQALLNSLNENQMLLRKIQADVQKFGETWQRRKQDYIDLYQFVSLCRDRLSQEDIRTSAESLLCVLDEIIVCNISDIRPEKREGNISANGIAIYFPWGSPHPKDLRLYQQLDFTNRHPSWLALITAFHS